jgi:RNA polymerase sigma factor (TIGR02999 family)
MSDVTHILAALDRGDPHAADELLPLVYDELRRLAAAQMGREKPGQTLDATALVHEAYLRLMGNPKADDFPHFAGRRHFYAAAAEAMRRILIDRARRKQSQKRGGELVRHGLDGLDIALPEPREDVIALDEALKKLAEADPQAAELVQLRFFAGFALLDAAEILGLSPRTAYRLWAYARAFLHRQMQG